MSFETLTIRKRVEVLPEEEVCYPVGLCLSPDNMVSISKFKNGTAKCPHLQYQINVRDGGCLEKICKYHQRYIELTNGSRFS